MLPSLRSDVDLLDKSKLEPTCNAILASTLELVRYKFAPSVILLVDNVISALPSKETPEIFLAVASVVAVLEFPVNAPVNVVAAQKLIHLY